MRLGVCSRRQHRCLSARRITAGLRLCLFQSSREKSVDSVSGRSYIYSRNHKGVTEMTNTWNIIARILIGIGCTFPEFFGWATQAINIAIRAN